MPITPLPDVAGRSLDGPGFTITEEENRALCASLGVAPGANGAAHPIYFYVATQVGMGLSVAELCAVCDFDVEDGPMMAGTKADYAAPLVTGRHYDVRGEIVGLTRKQSRKLGTMDLLEFRLHLDLPGEGRVCTVTNTWVLPRGQEDAA